MATAKQGRAERPFSILETALIFRGHELPLQKILAEFLYLAMVVQIPYKN
jgi:hypothetical protein